MNLLEGMAEARHAIGSLRCSRREKKREILKEWNDTFRAFPRDRCLHSFIEDQVERTPDAVAVVFEDKAYSY